MSLRPPLEALDLFSRRFATVSPSLPSSSPPSCTFLSLWWRCSAEGLSFTRSARTATPISRPSTCLFAFFVVLVILLPSTYCSLTSIGRCLPSAQLGFADPESPNSTAIHWIVWLGSVAFCCVIGFVIAEGIPVFSGLIGLGRSKISIRRSAHPEPALTPPLLSAITSSPL
jgi:hypothetical protein